MTFFRDTWIIFLRSMRLSLRQPLWVLIGLLQPILYLTLFGPMLQNIAATSGFQGDAWQVFVPGLLVQLGIFGGLFVGFGIIAEWRSGVVARLGAACSFISNAIGIATKSEDALAPMVNTLALPILLLSGILLPMNIAPQWLQIVSNFNPFKHIVEALRAVFRSDFSDPIVWIGVLLAAVLVVLGAWVGARTLTAQTR